MIYKNKLFLVIIALTFMFGGASIVNAQCWKYCVGGNCSYTTAYPLEGKECWLYINDHVETGKTNYVWGVDDVNKACPLIDKSECFKVDSQKCVDSGSYQLDGHNQCWGYKEYKGGENVYEWGSKTGSSHCSSGTKDEHCLMVSDFSHCLSYLGETFDLAKESLCASNYSADSLVSCGEGLLTDIPRMIPKTIHIIYLLIQILVPVLIVVFGSIDFVKAIIASKEDEIKKGQQIFIKRLIAGILLFFVFALVKIVVSFAGDENKSKVMNCASCLISNDSNCVGG